MATSVLQPPKGGVFIWEGIKSQRFELVWGLFALKLLNLRELPSDFGLKLVVNRIKVN